MMILRPDVTYITSVRQPAGTFNPVQDIMATTNAFTLAPMQFQAGAPLSGPPIQFLGTRGPMSAFFTRMRARYRNWKARRSGGLGFTPYGPRAWAGQQVMPMMDQRYMALARMGEQNLPPQFAPIHAGLGLISMRHR